VAALLMVGEKQGSLG